MKAKEHHTMKNKCQTRSRIVEIINKPGRFMILTQWTCGGAITCDSNEGPTDPVGRGPGYASFEDAQKKVDALTSN